MPRPLRAVLFDLDGTLIDSIGLIVDAMHHAFESMSAANCAIGLGCTAWPDSTETAASGPNVGTACCTGCSTANRRALGMATRRSCLRGCFESQKHRTRTWWS